MNIGFGWWHLPVLVDWGSVPGYFAGLAFLLAAWTYWQGFKERSRAQASLVSCWIKEDYFISGIWVKNGSSQQITSVEVFGSLIPNEAGLPPAELKGSENFPQEIPALGPGEGWEALSVDDAFHTIKLGGVRFVDAQGQRWERTYQHLKKI